LEVTPAFREVAAMSWGAEDLATALGASDNHGAFVGGYGFTYEFARQRSKMDKGGSKKKSQ
jgi:hypothetical protein